MRKTFLLLLTLLLCLTAQAKTVKFGKGQVKVTTVAKNAVRIQYFEGTLVDTLPDWLYVKHNEVESNAISVNVDARQQRLTVKNKQGRVVFTALRHQLQAGEAKLAFVSPEDEFLYGLGQFQDGYSNVRGLSRRLTQVNTQISIPMLLSNKGYGILWNNYGLTVFNPCDLSVALERRGAVARRRPENGTPTQSPH